MHLTCIAENSWNIFKKVQMFTFEIFNLIHFSKNLIFHWKLYDKHPKAQNKFDWMEQHGSSYNANMWSKTTKAQPGLWKTGL